MITLYQFYPVWGLPNSSPFCMKLETYFRMANITYHVHYIANPQHAPKGKLPFVKIDGEKYADSELIIAELKKRFGDPLDAELTPDQRALGNLIEYTLGDRLYWILLYWRWQDKEGWATIKDTYFKNLSSISRLYIPGVVRKRLLNSLYMQGMGRYSREEVIELGKKIIDSLVDTLGTKPYFLGDNPSSVDATAFAFLANMLMCPLDTPLKEYALQFDSLMEYCHLMWDVYYSDFAKR